MQCMVGCTNLSLAMSGRAAMSRLPLSDAVAYNNSCAYVKTSA